MRVAVIGNGDFIECGQHLKSYDLIMAADGGANHCVRLGITPDYIIGDGDSISAGVVTTSSFQANPDQNTTDLQKVFHYIDTLSWPADYAIDLFCVSSHERLDHTLAALQLLQYYEHVQTVYTPWQSIHLIRNTYQLAASPKTTFSLIPVTTAAIVNISGAQWSGQNILLDYQHSGISNITATPLVTITVTSGVVVCVTEIKWI